MKTKFLNKLKYDLKGHWRSQVILKFKNHLYLYNAWSFKNVSRMSTLWRHTFSIIISLSLSLFLSLQKFTLPPSYYVSKDVFILVIMKNSEFILVNWQNCRAFIQNSTNGWVLTSLYIFISFVAT